MKPCELSLIIIVLFWAIYFNGEVFGGSNNVKLKDDKGKTVDDKIKNKINESDADQKSRGKAAKILKLSNQLDAAKQKCWNVGKFSPKIINGNVPKRNSLSWMVAILRRAKNGKKFAFTCGGSLISTRFVLSAAHCFVNSARQWKIKSLSMVKVRYGMHNLFSKGYLESGVVNIFPHPRYMKTKGFFSDIALLKLEKTVVYSARVNPICIPFLTTPTTWNESNKRRVVQISGWGQTTQPSPRAKPRPNVKLRKGKAIILNEKVCKNYFRGLHNPSTTLCIGKTANRSTTCKGDSGGPISPIRFKGKSDRIVLPVVIGIVSFGNKVCSGPSVTTKVKSFIKWINKTTGK